MPPIDQSHPDVLAVTELRDRFLTSEQVASVTHRFDRQPGILVRQAGRELDPPGDQYPSAPATHPPACRLREGMRRWQRRTRKSPAGPPIVRPRPRADTP